jgi:hypothetical protein
LSLVFTLINPSNPGQRHSVAVQVDDDGHYLRALAAALQNIRPSCKP